jgi:hypothetical protein
MSMRYLHQHHRGVMPVGFVLQINGRRRRRSLHRHQLQQLEEELVDEEECVFQHRR